MLRSRSPLTPFPAIDLSPEAWHWPAPPFSWRHQPAPADDVPQPCRIETPGASAVDGEMVSMDPATGQLRFRLAADRPTCNVPLARIRRLTLTTPLLPEPRTPGAPLERVPAAAQERDYRLQGPADLPPLTGRTAGCVHADEGLYLFTPLDDERALERVFVPRWAYTTFEFGASAEERAAQRWIATPPELLEAIERQQRMPVLRIGEALFNLGLLTQRQLERALGEQRGDVPLGEALVAAGVITHSDLHTALAHKMGYPLVDLTRFPIEHSTARLLPLQLAMDSFALPLMMDSSRLIVAVDRPSRASKLHNVRAFAALQVVPVLASKSQIMLALGTLARSDLWSSQVFTRMVFAPSTV